MKMVMRPRYYCDYCKKSGGSKYHLRNHEVGCTANPNRTCRMCHMAGINQTPVAELVKIFRDAGGANGGLAALREASDGCPACMLAAIRQSRVQHAPQDEEDCGCYIEEFDFKAEKVEFWKRVSEDQREAAGDFYVYGY